MIAVPADGPKRVVACQGAIGLALAAALLAAFVSNYVMLVWVLDLRSDWLIALPLTVLQCWLCVGLFILAHDCMHGSLIPGRASWCKASNVWMGRLCLTLYAGFDFDRLNAAHHQHHYAPGSADDPDFNPNNPRRALPWFAQFVRRYFGIRELAVMTGLTALQLSLGAAYGNLLAFWAAPAILSALQLFYFGTYLPHRCEDDGLTHSVADGQFADQHRARTLPLPTWLSLLACYHFGYHHEHHRWPWVPWWRLPETYKGAWAAMRSPVVQRSRGHGPLRVTTAHATKATRRGQRSR